MQPEPVKYMNTNSSKSWSEFYRKRHNGMFKRYPTEWVVRTLAGGDYPELKIDKNGYKNARILDMGCGDGRNLPLLLDLGFEVYACEISSAIVENLERVASDLAWPIIFSTGINSNLPYEDCHFDYLLCSSSCYYLNDSATWTDVINELARVVKQGGLIVTNFPDENNAVLANSVRQPDGSLLITEDPFNLRNGSRFITPKNADHIRELLSPNFKVLAIGHQDDDYYGLRVSGYLVVAQKV